MLVYSTVLYFLNISYNCGMCGKTQKIRTAKPLHDCMSAVRKVFILICASLGYHDHAASGKEPERLW